MLANIVLRATEATPAAAVEAATSGAEIVVSSASAAKGLFSTALDSVKRNPLTTAGVVVGVGLVAYGSYKGYQHYKTRKAQKAENAAEKSTAVEPVGGFTKPAESTSNHTGSVLDLGRANK
ncbi:hypothetical protein ACLPJK_26025 [Pseudomonas aeruginosa]|uniref:hypothetical protein n=1 Tax=Pseudomonas aeruginosa TaxID=287 RepID=UPI003D2872BF